MSDENAEPIALPPEIAEIIAACDAEIERLERERDARKNGIISCEHHE